MLNLARQDLKPSFRIDTALLRFPPDKYIEEVEVGDARFSLILVHQAIGELTRSFGSIDRLAEWCFSRLQPTGRVGLSVYNREAKLSDIPPEWQGWNDPFRERLQKSLTRKGFTQFLRPSVDPLDESDIESAFAKAGFRLETSKLESVPMDFNEKLALWNIPAVLDSVVDLQKVESRGKLEELRSLVTKVFEEVESEEWMPRFVKFWVFSRN